jgi:magnesium transporter
MAHLTDETRISEKALAYLLTEKVPLLRRYLGDALEYEKDLESFVVGLHPSEVACLIQYLDPPYRELFINWLKPHFDPEIFLFLAENLREDIINFLSTAEIVRILDLLESDDAVEILTSFDPERKDEVLEALPLKKRQFFIHRLAFPELSAGRLMQTEVLTMSPDWTVAQGIEYIKSVKVPRFYDIFIVNSDNYLLGAVELHHLIQNPSSKFLHEVMDKHVRSIPVTWRQEEVGFLFRLYGLISAPVVDERNTVQGVITVDDVMLMVEKKAEEDLLHMGRIHGSDFYDSVLKTSFSRVHWLIITVANTLLTSLVINQFQETLQEKVALTILMPIAAAMGGNGGIQSTTVAIRALATRDLNAMNAFRTLLKEFRVALLNGAIFGFLLAGVAYIWFEDVRFSIILGGAIIFNMVWAGVAGITFPLVIFRLGQDPALSAGPLLTTTTDVFGYAIFLGLAYLLLH